MRDGAISIAKAIAIILMVIGHSACPSFLHDLIYQFHIPLFFFFSGYCFKDKYLSDFRTYAVRRVTGIYVPYVKYAVLFLLFHNVFYELNIYNGIYGYQGVASSLYSLPDFSARLFKITTAMAGEEQLLGGYWFMKILFLTSFVGYFFYRFLKGLKSQLAGLLVLYLFVLFLAKSDSLSAFWYSVSLTCFATIFFVAGKMAASYKVPQNIWFTLVCAVGVTALSIINPAGFTTKENIMLYAIGALFGILAVKNISVYIQKVPGINSMMTFIGNNTLSILTWHFLSFKLVSLLIIKIYDLPIELLASFPVIAEYSSDGWWVAYSIVGVVLPLCAVMVGKRVTQYVPFVISKNSQKQDVLTKE